MIIENLLSEDNILRAIEHLMDKPEQHGLDGQLIKDLPEY